MSFVQRAAGKLWDVVVVGAGPAGALTAREAARGGLSTLLIEGKRFPRDKVCGGCLNARGLDVLQRLGLNGVVERAGGVPLRQLRVLADGKCLDLQLPAGVALSRKSLDSQLVDEAIRAGVSFLCETTAVVEPVVEDRGRSLLLTQLAESCRVRARVVVCADGLLRSSLKHFPEFASQVAPQSRLGAGGIFADPSPHFDTGRIIMAVAREGYVGLTRVEDARLNMAAALDPLAVRGAGSIGELVRRVLEEAGCPVPEGIESRAWQGTPVLTSQPGAVSGERIFLVGDSAGYIEPFTGEGMATALESAAAVVPLVAEGVREWNPRLVHEWTRLQRQCFGQRQWICSTLAAVLRSPGWVGTVMDGCQRFPALPRFLISRINRPGPTAGTVNTDSAADTVDTERSAPTANMAGTDSTASTDSTVSGGWS